MHNFLYLTPTHNALPPVIRSEENRETLMHIKSKRRFVITTHLSPDGDALGASLGLYHFLKFLGKEEVQVIVPNEFPALYKWLPASERILMYDAGKAQADQLISQADVIFCLDYNDPKRIGKMAEAVLASQAVKIMLDHHPEPVPFCAITMSYPQISSTGELVFRLIDALEYGKSINKTMAECIYTGMMTDTGAFSYNSGNPETYLIISELLQTGIDKDAIYRKVYQVYSQNRLRLMGYVLHEKMKVYPDKQAALITLSREELHRFHYQAGDTEGFVNLLLNMDGITFAAFIREDTDLIKLSFRSVGDRAVNGFAAEHFNGGGHRNAAGGEFSGSLSDAITLFEQALIQ
jgi:phosphoesterase RecJ-like protein